MLKELDVRTAASQNDIAAVRDLWREYWRSIDLPDEFQGFGEELKGYPALMAQTVGCC
jgi:hypothetical protein